MRIILHCPVQIPSIIRALSVLVVIILCPNSKRIDNSTSDGVLAASIPVEVAAIAAVTPSANADPLVADQPHQSTSHQSSFVRLCRDPSFDASVAISDAHLMLFKRDQIWLLNIADYNVGQPFRFNSTFGNLNSKQSCRPTIYNSNLYVWNVHDHFAQFSDQICINRNGQVCHFTVEVVTPQNKRLLVPEYPSIRYDQDLLNITRNGSQWSGAICDQYIDANVIQHSLIRQWFDKSEGLKRVWLFGLHFLAQISFVPQTYDNGLVLIKSELVKLSRETNNDRDQLKNIFLNIQDNKESRQTSRLELEDNLTVEDVNTFTILPNGEVIVFFGHQFCYINYYKLTCSARATSNLIGCSVPEHEFGKEQIYVLEKKYDDLTPETVANQTNGSTSMTSVGVFDLPDTTTTPSTPETLSPIASSIAQRSYSSKSPIVSTDSPTSTTARGSSSSSSPSSGLSASSTADFTVTALNSSPSSVTKNESKDFSESTSSLPTEPSPPPTTATTSSTTSTTTSDANRSQILSKSPYDIDYFYRKRDEFRKNTSLLSSSQTKRQTSQTVASQLNLFGFDWDDHTHYVTLGFAVYFEILRRASTIFFSITLVIQIALILFLGLLYSHNPSSMHFELLAYIFIAHFFSSVHQF